MHCRRHSLFYDWQHHALVYPPDAPLGQIEKLQRRCPALQFLLSAVLADECDLEPHLAAVIEMSDAFGLLADVEVRLPEHASCSGEMLPCKRREMEVTSRPVVAGKDFCDGLV